MKNFFKITSFKIILTLIIVVLTVAGLFLYNRSIIVSEQGIEIKANFAVKILHQISNTILFPVRTVNTPILKFLLKDYYGSTTEISPFNPLFNSGWLLFFVFFLLSFLIEAYIISCVVFLLFNKIKLKKKE